LREALNKLSVLRGEVRRHEERLAQNLEQERAIAEDQQRLRQNLTPLRDQSDLRRRYIAKLDDQENELERLRSARELIRRDLEKAQEDLRAFIAELDVG
jgi:hypothetical protein